MRVVSRTEVPALVDATAESTTLRLDAPVRETPARIPVVPQREQLERELDRVQGAIQAGDATFGQQITWLLLGQALFLNAYLLVLVFGPGAALPGKRWLLAGLAIFAATFAVLTYLALRGSRDASRALRAQRRELEAVLAKLGRDPVFAPRNFVSAGLSSFASSLLPASFVAGWVAISIYALAVPTAPRPPEDLADAVPPALETPAAANKAARPAAPRPAVRPVAPNGAQTAPGSESTETAERAATEPVPQEDAPKKRTGFKW
jgi:hypothetical protein